MSLADEARADANRRGGGCTIGALLGRLPEPDRSELIEALADSAVQSTALARVLKRRDINVGSGQNVGRHRRGDCQCPA